MAVSLASSAFIEIFETSSTLWLAPFLAGARVGARRVFFKTPDPGKVRLLEVGKRAGKERVGWVSTFDIAYRRPISGRAASGG